MSLFLNGGNGGNEVVPLFYVNGFSLLVESLSSKFIIGNWLTCGREKKGIGHILNLTTLVIIRLKSRANTRSYYLSN